MNWFKGLFEPSADEIKMLADYNKHAFCPTKRDYAEGLWICDRLADEIRSSGGKVAVALSRPSTYSGTPIHEINKNGTFSSKAPYFVSRSTNNWNQSGKRHLIQTLYSKTNLGFKTSNKDSGVTPEVGIAIVEYNTDKFPPITMSDLRQMLSYVKRDEELRRLFTARMSGQHYLYQGSPLKPEFMFGKW
ncbi:hypothetical protein [Geomonas propionica]|uniref:Uncharacterized protein n=1 Tax=Geomonas propionica TaxID=2798582 RepID=A0ABS0YY17_9BACT|nr:hypothetical protein [Geomonas propionica]MBJ6802763.1 hypothetical protein [Geomonas propionica]